MANILFKKGSYSQFNEKILQNTEAIEDGALYLTEDEGGLYLGKVVNGTKSVQRIQGSVLYFESLDEFTENIKPPYSQDVIYFIANTNSLVRWDGSKWIALNVTAADAAKSLADLDTKISAEATKRAEEDAKLLALINTNIGNINTNSAAIALKADQSALAAEVAERQTLAIKVAENTTAAANADTKAEAAQTAAEAAQTAADTADAKAVAAQSAADQANANANNRVAQGEFNEFKASNTATIENINGLISQNGTRIESINQSIIAINNKDNSQDIAIEGKLNIDGSNAMVNNLNMGTNQIINVKAGTENTHAINKQQLDTAIAGVDAKITETNTKVTNLTTKLSGVETGLADTGINLTNKQITLQNDLIADGKKITGLADGEKDNDAATVGQIKNAIAANDAMTFRGTLGGSKATISSLPTTALAYSTDENHPLKNLKPQRGDTFKVAVQGEYAGTAAKVGDLFINIGMDDADPKWEHISSGYEDDYLQKLFVKNYAGDDVAGIQVNITNGIGDTASHGTPIIIQTSTVSNLQFSNNGNVITASMAWGTF